MKDIFEMWAEIQDDDTVNIYGWRKMPKHSVLAGQMTKVFLDSGSQEEMIGKYPHVEAVDGRVLSEIHMSDIEPDWFDQDDAGERW